jgi:phage terminase small subunit
MGKLATISANGVTADAGELSPKQKAFAAAYVRLGGHGERAAIEAGFAPKSARVKASQLLRLPKVQAEVRAQAFSQVDKLAPKALAVLVEIIEDPNAAPRDRTRAAEAILDRGFLHKVSRQEVEVEHRVSPAEIIAEVWARRDERLAGQGAKLIEGDARRLTEDAAEAQD